MLDHGCGVYSAPSRSVYSSNSSSCGVIAMYFCFLVLASSSLSSWLIGAVTMISRSICAARLLTSRAYHNCEAALLTLSFWTPLVVSQPLSMGSESIHTKPSRLSSPLNEDLPSSRSCALLVPCLQTFVPLASFGAQPSAMVQCVSVTCLAVNGKSVRRLL